MRMSAQGMVELANYEALSHTKYLCSANVQTIGIGMTVSEIPDIKQWAWDRVLPTEDCVEMYKASLTKYEDAVNRKLKVEIDQHKFDVLVSITYNIGTGGMAGSTFMSRINAGESDERVCEAMQRWNKANGRVIKGLNNRRLAESKIYKTGVYTNDGTVGLIKVDANHRPKYTGGRISIIQYF